MLLVDKRVWCKRKAKSIARGLVGANMKFNKLQNSSSRRVATILGAAALLMTAAQPSVVLAATSSALSPAQRQQETELASKLSALVTKLGPNATAGAYEGAFADAVAGYDTAVIEAALADLAGTPSLPAGALTAATGQTPRPQGGAPRRLRRNAGWQQRAWLHRRWRWRRI